MIIKSFFDNCEIVNPSWKHEMKGFTPTAESHGFRLDLLWSGLRSGLPATGLSARSKADLPVRLRRHHG